MSHLGSGDEGAFTDGLLAKRLSALARAGKLPGTLREAGVAREDLPALAQDASEQWTGRFNPRPFGVDGAREVYECAF
jgi:alcohol dehydrogenase class IV